MKVKNDLLDFIVEITMSSQNIKKNIIQNITIITNVHINISTI